MDYQYNGYDGQNRSQKGKLRTVAIVLVFFMLGAVIATGAMTIKMQNQVNAISEAAQEQMRDLAKQLSDLEAQATAGNYLQNTSSDTLLPSDDEDPVVSIAENCKPSIVGVTTYVKQSSSGNSYGSFPYSDWFPFQVPGYDDSQPDDNDSGEEAYTEYSFGSGVILTTDGYILTNHHVIESADKVTITLNDGREIPATVIGSDQYLDVALLKLDEEVDGLVPATIGDSDNIKVGEMAVAIGNPLGKELLSTVTMGVISAKDRMIDVSENGESRIIKTIQTDAAINSGNSGGGLFNSKGELIGITTLKMSSSYSNSASVEGLGFAIPINEAMSIVSQLMDSGTVTRPTLGISARNFTEADAAEYPNTMAGIQIDSITSGSSAEGAGLERLDIITHFNGDRVTTFAELKSKLNYCSVGDTVVLTIIRDGQSMEVTMTLTSGSSM